MREGLRSSAKFMAAGSGSDDKVSKFISSNLKHREREIGEPNESRKRNRIDNGIEREDDNYVKNQKLREGDRLYGKPPVSRRVLRSMTALKSEGKSVGLQSSNKFIRKRNRIDSGIEKEDDQCAKKQKLRQGDMFDGKPPASRRVSRSMTALNTEGKVINEKEQQINGGLVEERFRGKVGQGKESVKVKNGCVAARTRGELVTEEKRAGVGTGFVVERTGGKLVTEEKRVGVGTRFVVERTRGKVVPGASRVDLKNGCLAGRTRGKVGAQDKNVVENGFASTKPGGNGSVNSRTRGKVGSDCMVFEADNGSLAERCQEKSVRSENSSVDQLAGEGSSHLDNEAGGKLKLKSERLLQSNKGDKVGAKRRGRPPKYGVPDLNRNVENNSPLPGKKFGIEYNLKMQKAEKIDRSKNKKAMGDAKQKTRKKPHSRDKRQEVRAKIQELLQSAGWTIEYRSRKGRTYMDAVYVNPEGRTHWSITLAYRVLKKRYEDGGGDSAAQKPSFKFTPVPEEELHLLMKVKNKQHCDKDTEKKKRKWGEDGEIISGSSKKKNWKVQKRKLGDMDDDTHKMLGEAKKLKSMRGKLMVCNSQDAESAKDGYVFYNGKRTVLSWMIDTGTVLENAKVQYMKRKEAGAVMRGSVTPNGIKCDCCFKTMTNSEFETHAGEESCQPLQNIYLENGVSLLQCQLDSWLKEDVSAHKGFHFVDVDSEDPNVDECKICGRSGNLICYRGNLICCDSCPSMFHQCCREIRMFPSGQWHCMYCFCKFCGMVGENTCQIDDAEACSPHLLLACQLCEDKYHPSCIQEDIMNVDPDGTSTFCGKKCEELYERLQRLIGVRHELEDGFSCTFVRRFEIDSDIPSNEIPRKVDCNSKVAVALQIMKECFKPMTDNICGINQIHNIVYNIG